MALKLVMLPNTSAPSSIGQQRPYLQILQRSEIIQSMSKGNKRRGKISEENVEESNRLRKIWDSTLASRAADEAGTQEAFGAKYSIGNQAAVGHFLNGKTALSMKAALGFARGLRCEVGDFSPRLAARLLPTAWPFERISPTEWEDMGPKWQGVVENAAVEAWRELQAEQQRSQPRKAQIVRK